MSNQVTSRFICCLEQLKKDNKFKSYRQFALSVDYFPQGLNEILKGKRNATIDLIQKTSKLYNINTNYLFHGSGSMFIKKSKDPSILTIVTDSEGIEKIVHVPVSAHAGYSENITNPIFFEQLSTFNLPGFGFNTGTYRCFDVAGDSMEPIIYNQEQLICSYVDPDLWFNNIRNNIVYVIVTQDSVLVKRIERDRNDNKRITLVSDNDFYEPFTLNFSEIKEIWTVKMKLSDFTSSPRDKRNDFKEEIDHMKTTVTEQSSLIKNLNTTIERLLHISTNKTV